MGARGNAQLGPGHGRRRSWAPGVAHCLLGLLAPELPFAPKVAVPRAVSFPMLSAQGPSHPLFVVPEDVKTTL